jgi:hypothetical protein
MPADFRSDETKMWHRMIAEAVATERERCAKIAENARASWADYPFGSSIGRQIAAAIRESK